MRPRFHFVAHREGSAHAHYGVRFDIDPMFAHFHVSLIVSYGLRYARLWVAIPRRIR